MKNLFGFNQEKLIQSNINLTQAVLLAYFNIKSGQELTYQSIVSDLPILGVGTRQIRRLIDELVKNEDLIKTNTTKNAFIIELGQKWPNNTTTWPNLATKEENLAKNGHENEQFGQKWPTIYKLNNNNNFSNNNYIYNTLSHNNIYNIIYNSECERQKLLLNIWKLCFPNKFIPENVIFSISDNEFDIFINKIAESSFLMSRPYLDYRWCLRNKDKILNNIYADIKEESNFNKNTLCHNYDSKNLDYLYTNINEVEI